MCIRTSRSEVTTVARRRGVTGRFGSRAADRCRAESGHFLPFARVMKWTLERLVHTETRPMGDARLSATADVHVSTPTRVLADAHRSFAAQW